LKEAGEMSIKNLTMLALTKYEEGKYNDTILYLGKVLDKTDGNMMMVELPSSELKVSETITMLSPNSPHQAHSRCYKLNLLAYIYLA
jgi:hypothetical protein